MTYSFAAADLDASSGRVMLGRVGPDVLELSQLRRFRNGPVRLPDGLHRDVLGLYLDVLAGLREAARVEPDIRSVAVDSWAVDYGLVRADGSLVGNPFHYRDQRTALGVARVHRLVSQADLYRVNGLQHLPFNTGQVVGGLSGSVLTDTGLPASVRLALVGSHDTASAVVAVPAVDERFAYIPYGIWGLVGVELDAPVLTDDSAAANFTTERGVDGTVRYLRNVMGLWLLQESLWTWRLSGLDHGLSVLLAEVGVLSAGGPTFDPDESQFLASDQMPTRIAAACIVRGIAVPATPAQIARCILDSLALAFASAVADASRLSGQAVGVLYIVGGGSQNALLCQLTADLWQARDLVRRTHHSIEYRPWT
jgi:rhamnulokinase